MPYTHFRYIAYSVPTATDGNDKIPHGEAIQEPPKLKGDTANLGQDGEIRIKRFIKVLEKAKQLLKKAGDKDNILKVFVAPEFYFRPDNPDKAYSLNEYRAIKDVLTKTIAGEDKNDYDHWLIVCGTIVWKNPYVNVEKKRQDKAYHNTCFYIMGNWNKGNVTKGIIEKTEVSDIDGVPKNDSEYPVTEKFKIYYDLSYLNKHIFSAGGITFGLEICREHSMFSASKLTPKKILKKKYPDDTGYEVAYGLLKKVLNEVGNRSIQLQILIAAGMTIEETSVVVNNNGYLLRNDGLKGVAQLINASDYCELDLQAVANEKNKYTSDIKTDDDVLNKWSTIKSSADSTLIKPKNYYAVPKLKSAIQTAAKIDLHLIGLAVPPPSGIDDETWKKKPQSIIVYKDELISKSPLKQ